MAKSQRLRLVGGSMEVNVLPYFWIEFLDELYPLRYLATRQVMYGLFGVDWEFYIPFEIALELVNLRN